LDARILLPELFEERILALKTRIPRLEQRFQFLDARILLPEERILGLEERPEPALLGLRRSASLARDDHMNCRSQSMWQVDPFFCPAKHPQARPLNGYERDTNPQNVTEELGCLTPAQVIDASEQADEGHQPRPTHPLQNTVR
jgi:hypothetical protein